MKNLKCLFLTDMQRVFSGPKFWILAAGVMAVYFCNTLQSCLFMDHFTLEGSVVENMGLTRGTLFTQMALILATLAYGTSFCEDWKNRNIRNIIIRSDIPSYAVSKMLACVISAFGVLFVGNLLFALLEMILTGSVYGSTNLENLRQGSLFNQLLGKGDFIPWLLIESTRSALEGAVFASISLTVSTVMTNPFVVLTLPIFIYFFANLILQTNYVPPIWNMIVLYETDTPCIGGSIIVHMLWTLIISMILCIVFAWIFLKGVRRKFENG